MIVNNKVIQKWNSKKKKHYIELGYKYTKIGNEFEVDVHDLPDSSNAIVYLTCDYCGKSISKPWYRYIRENKNTQVHTDCCVICKKYKITKTAQLKYGVNSVFSIDAVKEKIRNTNIQRYGHENPFSSEQVKQKIVATNIETYGYKSAMQSEKVKERARKTCFEKHGVPYYVMKYRLCGADSPRWKGGVASHRVERATNEYNLWRRNVYSKDNYTCQCCGIHSGCGKSLVLNAHHIYNWKDNPKLRYNVENGITLCSNCHVLFHKYYGKNNNTRDQLQQFLIEHGKKIC